MSRDRPWFLWDVEVDAAGLRERLHQADPDARAQWQARVLRDAHFSEVWEWVTLDEVLRDWRSIERHLGRMRPFWEFLLSGWRADGLLPAA
jgi:hypothetical protein